MANPESFPYINRSPLDKLGIELTPEQAEAVLDAIEQRAIEKSEDHLPASQPSYDINDLIGEFYD